MSEFGPDEYSLEAFLSLIRAHPDLQVIKRVIGMIDKGLDN